LAAGLAIRLIGWWHGWAKSLQGAPVCLFPWCSCRRALEHVAWTEQSLRRPSFPGAPAGMPAIDRVV